MVPVVPFFASFEPPIITNCSSFKLNVLKLIFAERRKELHYFFNGLETQVPISESSNKLTFCKK